MEDQESGAEDTFEHIDADAVCEQCSTVNPAGTLLCKTCGNNLRDQRMRRLAADEGIEAVHVRDRPIRMLTGLLVVLGLLAILWAAINVYNGTIENWLTNRITETQTDDGIDPNQFWSGSDASLYEEMSRELRENPITDEEAAAGPSAGGTTLDGRYVVRSHRANSPIAGLALVRTRGGTIHFVAQFGRIVELRGRVASDSDSQFEADQAGAMWGDTVLDAYGIARLQPDGSFSCAGRVSGSGDRPYSGTAYKVSATE